MNFKVTTPYLPTGTSSNIHYSVAHVIRVIFKERLAGHDYGPLSDHPGRPDELLRSTYSPIGIQTKTYLLRIYMIKNVINFIKK